MTGSRDPGTMGVSCLCLTHILFIILFCSGGRKFAQAKDFSLLIISALTQDCKLCNSRTAFPLRPLQMLLIVELLQQRRSEEKFDLQKKKLNLLMFVFSSVFKPSTKPEANTCISFHSSIFLTDNPLKARGCAAGSQTGHTKTCDFYYCEFSC